MNKGVGKLNLDLDHLEIVGFKIFSLEICIKKLILSLIDKFSKLWYKSKINLFRLKYIGWYKLKVDLE